MSSPNLRRLTADSSFNASEWVTFSPLLQRIYAHRQLVCPSELDYQLPRLTDPFQMKGMRAAADRLADAVILQQNVLIVGDFDADGATSSSLAVLALRALGLSTVDFLVPNRFEFGYGLSPPLVHVAKQSSPDLLVTVDNGIASVDGVAAAKQLGMDVIVTDHHLPGDTLPDADAIVNPNQEGCLFPSKNLAGVGVIFYVMLALRVVLRERGWFAQSALKEPNMAQFLDLVALGTVADVVPLDSMNRLLIHQGIQRIRRGLGRIGIQRLLDIAGRDHQRLVSADLGFAVGPRLNAAGRLDDMSLGIRCLITSSDQEAMQLANQLDELNRERKAIETSMQAEALNHLSEVMVDLPSNHASNDQQWGLAVTHDTWHQGVIGILASRLKDRFYRPVIAFAPDEADTLKGSARSIPGVHIRDLLDKIATQNPKILQKFGGHAMAAGLSLEKRHFAQFSRLFNQAVAEALDYRPPEAEIISDGELLPNDFSLPVAHDLQEAGPWGQAFPEPQFDGVFQITNVKVLADKHIKMQLAPDLMPELRLEAIWFNAIEPNGDGPDWMMAALPVRQRFVFKLNINAWKGVERLQLMIEAAI